LYTGHCTDFTIYAHLQLAQDGRAKRIVDEALDYQRSHEVTKLSMTGQTGFAAISARYVLERKAWGEAVNLELLQKDRAYAEAIIRFTRSLGASRTGQLDKARTEIHELQALRESAIASKESYWEGQIEVLRLAASAWLAQAQGQTNDALRLMREAANLEDSSEKHVAMENRLYPMRELLADLLLENGQPQAAMIEYEASLLAAPNRFNAFYGAARAAELMGDKNKSRAYFEKLLVLAKDSDTERPEIATAKLFLAVR